jgi:hypothetical protein
VFFISNRDFVTRRKIWKGLPDEDSILIHNKSTTHIDFPEKSSPVRGEVILQSIYIKTISHNPPKVRLAQLNQNHLRGNFSDKDVNKNFPGRIKEMIANIKSGLVTVFGKTLK